MQFVCFHLMPYPDLPADFEERYESAWLTCPNTLFDPVRGHTIYNQYLDQLEAAERLGFDVIGVNEHHQNAYGLMPSPNIMAACLARRTSRIKILVLGNALPLYDHPMRVAEELAMLDVITGGRLITGMVVGLGVEAFTYEVNPTFIRERYREAHDLIVRAWTEPGPFHFEGKHYDFRYVNVWPRPFQQPHPPIWVPGSGSVETIRWVAEKRYPFIAIPFSPFVVMKEHFDVLKEYAWTQLNYEVPPAQMGWPAMIYVAETDAQAREEFEPHFWYLARKGLRIPREYMFPPGHTSVESLLRVSGPRRKFINALSSWDEADEGLYAVVGSPATVRDKMREAIKQVGCGIVQGIFQVGSLPHELALKNMELFAREVMPALRAEFPG
jgi:alkanesulfonate monooxygenase SsuD/methylene tetrahydromethanopterin reductase-like flavin-dependent oxidoreductase (luciferase family)